MSGDGGRLAFAPKRHPSHFERAMTVFRSAAAPQARLRPVQKLLILIPSTSTQQQAPPLGR
jgi:hypothetical protein